MTAVCVMEAVFESEHANTIIISIETCTLLLQYVWKWSLQDLTPRLL